jgi:hypothetical protein
MAVQAADPKTDPIIGQGANGDIRYRARREDPLEIEQPAADECQRQEYKDDP